MFFFPCHVFALAALNIQMVCFQSQEANQTHFVLQAAFEVVLKLRCACSACLWVAQMVQMSATRPVSLGGGMGFFWGGGG